MDKSIMNFPKVGVGVLVFKENKILLGYRINSHGEASWSPPGGHLEFGEDPQVCAKRELFEETGLKVESIKTGPWTNDIFQEDNKHYVSLFMIVKDFYGVEKVMETNKCQKWEWFNFSSLPNPLFLPLKNLLKKCSLEEVISLK